MAKVKPPVGQGISITDLHSAGGRFLTFLNEQVFTFSRGIEVALVLAALGLAALLAPRLGRFLIRFAAVEKLHPTARDSLKLARALALPALWLLFQWITLVCARQFGQSTEVLVIAVNLLGAWVVIRLVTRLIRQTVWSNLAFATVWILVALNILGVLDPLIASLDKMAMGFGTVRISVYTILKGMLALGILLWAASVITRFVSDRIRHIEDLTPSVQVLLSKLLQFVLAGVAIILALSIIGIDLTAFAVFGGAIGIGIGLGLQKAASNVMGGLMLLIDKTIKPGDVISIHDTFGWVTSLGGNYVSVRTRDGIEHLIPNEVFMTNGVANWSFSDRAVRLKLALGVAYDSDLHRVIALCVEAAKEVPRIVSTPEPICIITGFGDNSVSLELRVWILDPENGVGNAKGAVYLKVWDKFKANGIEIPFPQRDIHIKASPDAASGNGAAALRPLLSEPHHD